MSKLTKNILSNFIGQFLVAIIGFIAIKYIYKQLGEDVFGIMMLSALINSTLTVVLERSIATSTTREISLRSGENQYIHSLISTVSFYYWGIYVVLSLLLFFTAPLIIGKWVNIISIDKTVAIFILRVSGISAFIAIPRSLYASIFRGLQRMEINNLIDVMSLALQQAGIILILFLGYNLFYVFYWMAVSAFFGILIYLFALKKYFPLKIFIPRHYSQILKQNNEYASKMTYISILSMVNSKIDKIILSKLLPIGVFGYYNFANGIITKLYSFTGATAQAAFPSFSDLFKKNKPEELFLKYKKLHDLTCIVNIPVLVSLMFIQTPLFTYLLNREAANILFFPFILLCVGSYMNTTLNIPYIFSLAVGKPEITLRSTTYVFILITPITIGLTYSFGLTGAAVSWICFNMFFYIYTVPRIYNECLSKSAWGFYKSVCQVCTLGVITFGIGWITIKYFSLSIIFVVLIFMVSVISYFITAFFILIDDDFRRTLLVQYSGILNKVRCKVVEQPR